MRTGASRTVVKAVLVALAVIMMVLPATAREPWKVVDGGNFFVFVPSDWTVVETWVGHIRMMDDDEYPISFDAFDAEGQGYLIDLIIDLGSQEAIDDFTEALAEVRGVEWIAGAVWPFLSVPGISLFALDDTGAVVTILTVARGDDKIMFVTWYVDTVDIYTINKILLRSLPPSKEEQDQVVVQSERLMETATEADRDLAQLTAVGTLSCPCGNQHHP